MRNRGFTLIEVLIALVIFVVGALAVIRIFPPAYNVVQNSGYSTVATRLSDSILAQMKGEGSTPEAVFDINDGAANWATDPVESNWQDQDGAVVGTSDTNGSLPSGLTESAYDGSALGHFRFIRGEKHEVQVASVTDPVSGTVTKEPYILTNFPYEVNSGVRAYIELAISDVTVDNTGLLDFTNATYTDPVSGVKTSFHDSGNANRPPTTITIAGASLKTRSEIPQGAGSLVNSGTRYYVSYQWRYTGAANPAGNTVINEPVGIPDNTSTSWSGTDTMRVVQGRL